MKTRFIIDVPTGAISRTENGNAVATARVGLLTARDVMDCEIVFTAGGVEITNGMLPNGTELRLGLRAIPGVAPLLALSDSYTLANGVASCTFDLNTQGIVDLVSALPARANKTAPVYFEVEIAEPDGSSRQTIVQSLFSLQREVITDGDEPPATAEDSAANASASAAAAAASASQAAASAAAAASSATAAANSATSANTSKVAAQTAQTAAEAANTAALAAQAAAAASASAAATSAAAAATSATNANNSAVAAAAAQTAAVAAKVAAEAAQAAALASQTAAASSQTAAATSETNAANSATASAASAAAAAASAAAAALAVANQYLGGVAGNAVPATASTAGQYYRITSSGTSQSKTWAVGDMAIYNGTSGSWTQLAGILPYATTAQALADVDTGNAMNAARVAERVNKGALSRATRDYLYSDGVTSNRRLQFAPGAAGAFQNFPICMPFEFRVTPANPGTNYFIWFIGTNQTPNGAGNTDGNCLSLMFNASGNLEVRQAASVATNNRTFNYSGFRAAYAGQMVRGMVVFSTPGSAPTVYINGIDVTASFTPASAGTPPAWLDSSITPTYFLNALLPPGEFFPHGFIIGSLTAAEVLEWTQTGRLPDWCILGTAKIANLLPNSDFALDPTVAANGRWTFASGITWDNVNGEIDLAPSVAASAACSGVATDVWSFNSGRNRAWRITFTIKNYVSGAVRLCTPSNTSFFQLNGAAVPFLSANGTYTYDILGAGAGAFAFITQAAASLSIDDVVVKQLGPIFKPVIQPIAVVADAGENKIAGILTAGVTPITDKRDWVIQFLTNLATNQQILGASVFFDFLKVVIETWWINNGGTSKTVSLGNVSAGTQYQSGGTFAAGRVKATLATQVPATNNLWVNSNGVDPLQHTIRGYLVD